MSRELTNGPLLDVCNQLNDLLEATTRSSLGALAAEVVTTSPVDSGTYRASWTPSIGVEQPIIIDRRNNPAARETQQFSGVINDLQMGETFYLSNAVPYAALIEFTDHSPQGTAIAQSAASRFPSLVTDVIAGYIRGFD